MKRSANLFCQLSQRAQKLLADNGIDTLETLCAKTRLEVHRLPGCGHKTVAEIDDILKQSGLVYRTDKPSKDFVDLYDRLKLEYDNINDFREMGSRYGISADVMYQIYQGSERAERMYQKSLTEHMKWQTQFGERAT